MKIKLLTKLLCLHAQNKTQITAESSLGSLCNLYLQMFYSEGKQLENFSRHSPEYLNFLPLWLFVWLSKNCRKYPVIHYSPQRHLIKTVADLKTKNSELWPTRRPSKQPLPPTLVGPLALSPWRLCCDLSFASPIFLLLGRWISWKPHSHSKLSRVCSPTTW